MRDVVIVGAGPAGLAAAIYAGRYERRPLVVDAQGVGGQMLLTTDIDNYPGFPEGIRGAELASLMQQQAERFGAEFLLEPVLGVDFSGKPLRLRLGSGQLEARTVILAPGTSRRKLGVPGEQELAGRGVSYCATCDGFFFRGKVVAVVGGGDSALEEALVLTRYASKVYLVHRRDQWRAAPVLQEQVRRNEKIEPIWNTVVARILGGERVEAVELQEVGTRECRMLPVEGVFIFVGSAPNTDFLRGALPLDERGYIIADSAGRTQVPGVFAAGEAVAGTWAQIVVAAASGATAAYAAELYLAEEEGKAPPPRTY
jgi:thioredoxin reductase (NADPH)